MEVSYTYIYLINWVSIRKWACQYHKTNPKKIDSLRNIFMKIHLSFRRNQLCNLNARFLMCAIYHQTNPKKIDSLKDVFCGKRSCLAYSSWMILMKIHLSFKRNQLCNWNARFFMCAICHQTNQKKIDSLKDLFSWKKNMLDLETVSQNLRMG